MAEAVPAPHRWATFWAVAVIYLALPNIYPGFMSPNEYTRLWTARAILEQHSLQIDRYVGNRPRMAIADVSFYSGHFYSDKAAGMSLASVPALALLHLFAPRASDLAQLFAARFIAVTVPALIAIAFIVKRCKSRIALLAVVGLCLGSVVFPQALGLTGHLPMTIALCTAAALATWGDLSLSRAALIGLLAGAAILIDFTSAIAVAAIFAIVAIRTKSIRAIVVFGVCCAAIASIQLAINARCFAGPLDFGYRHEFNPIDQANRGAGFFGIGRPRLESIGGLTFGTMQGIFTHSPFLLFAIPAMAAAIARRRTWIRLWIIAVCAAYFYLNSTLPDWEGGWSLGPRYLTLLYPLLTYLTVDWLQQLPESSLRYLQPLFVIGVTWSVLLYLASMLTWSMPPQWKSLSFPGLELSSYLMFHRAFAPNAFAWIGLPVAFVLALSALIVLIAVAIIALNSGMRSAPYVAAAILLFVIALSRATPAYDSEIARQFQVFLRFMGHRS